MNIIQSIIYGVVEGLTEFLPISSTGHLIIVSKILGDSSEFIKTFEIVIQLGAILAVVVIYGKKLLTDFDLFKKIVTAFIPTSILGLIFYKIIKQYLLGNIWVVAAAMLIGGVMIILFEKWYKNKPLPISSDKITYKQSGLIGLAQSVAMIPGVSRSAATIIGGLALGLDRKQIVEFSFWLAVPTMAAASGLDLVKNYQSLAGDQLTYLVIGFVTAFIAAFAAIKVFLKFIQKNDFIIFGVYRIIIGLILLRWIL